MKLTKKKKYMEEDFSIGTKIINHSFDNEKDQNWFVKEATTLSIVLAHKKYGTRNKLDDIELTWKEFKSMITEGSLSVDGFNIETELKALKYAIDNFIAKCAIEEKDDEILQERKSGEEKVLKSEKEIKRLKGYEKAVKNRTEKRKNARISEREARKKEIELQKAEINFEIEKEKEKIAMREIININKEMLADTKNKKQKEKYQDTIDLYEELIEQY